MDTPYLIEEYLQMSASGEAKLKFPMWERQMFQKKEFFCHKKIFFLHINLLQLLTLGIIMFFLL